MLFLFCLKTYTHRQNGKSVEFKRGRDSLKDDPRPGRPADVIRHEMIDRIEGPNQLQILLTLKAPIATKVVCFSRLSKC